MIVLRQRTIKQSLSVEGIGLHTGKAVKLSLRPAAVDHGIRYYRLDFQPPAELLNDPWRVNAIPLCTCLENVQGVTLATVEHLNAALAGLGVDNIIIEVNGPELPILDGSAFPWVSLLLQAGIEELDQPKQFLWVTEPVKVQEGDKWVEVHPQKNFCVDCTIDFDHPTLDESTQHYHFTFSTQSFVQQISQARTFGFMRDIVRLQAQGLCLGGNLACAVVLDDQQVLNPEGLRFPNELVRHKILDAVGDLFMGGRQILGSVKAFKPGHALNNRLLRTLLSQCHSWKLAPLDAANLFSLSDQDQAIATGLA